MTTLSKHCSNSVQALSSALNVFEAETENEIETEIETETPEPELSSGFH